MPFIHHPLIHQQPALPPLAHTGFVSISLIYLIQMRYLEGRLPFNHQQLFVLLLNVMQGLNPKIVMALAKQTQDCQKKSPDGVSLIVNQSDATDIQAEILGPVGTPYEGGVFRCKLVVENDFPTNPPKGYFITKIFHPNVSEKGEICVNTLKKDWDPTAWSLRHILQIIKCLLIVPFPESALNQEAGKMFMEDYEEYCKHSKLLTELYAKSKELKSLENSQTMEKKQSTEEKRENPQKKENANNKKKWIKRI